jgi:hypothetical protein
MQLVPLRRAVWPSALSEIKSTLTSSVSILVKPWLSAIARPKFRRLGKSSPTTSPVTQLFSFLHNIFPLRPLRMYRRWRPVVSRFRADELLYRRHRREDIVNGTILPAALPFPKKNENTGQSVNRSAFSKPEDALWGPAKRLDGMGVFEFPVSCLPGDLSCPATARQFTFWPKHVPLGNNYAHSEIWSDELPRRNAEYVLPTKLVCKELRARIQQNSRVVIDAEW